MEAQRANPAPEKKSRSDAERVSPSFATGENPLGTPAKPIYADQSPSTLTSHVGESIEGFVAKNSRDTGMQNLENTENFGARFQMPEPQTADNFLSSPSAPSLTSPRNEGETALDVQASVQAIQELVHKIRSNLESAEQEELEELLRQGADMLSTHYKTLSRLLGDQVQNVKSELKENPYRSLVSALKVGMALSQVYFSHKEARSLSQPESGLA